MHLAIAYVVVYLVEALVIIGLFVGVRRLAAERLITAKVFGKAEHPLGLLLGGLRFATMMFLLLAVLNVFDLSTARLWLKENRGGDNFRSLVLTICSTLQQEVFEESICGIWLRRDVPYLLATPVPVADETVPEPMLEQRKRLIDNTLHSR
jgi:uncharacterized membrane protein required for colicin V production